MLKLVPSKLTSILIICFFILGSFGAYAFASTDVGGTITEDTTWTLNPNPPYNNGSPYIVTSNITINSGATLTIEPGVQIKFSAYYSLTVNGSLVASGTPSQNITFTSNNTTPGIGDWSGIWFTDTSNDATCIISYAVVEYTTYGIYAINASPLIQNNILQNNTYGVYCQYASSPSITNNTIINDYSGVYINGNLTSYPNPAINNNSIYNNIAYNLQTNISTGNYSSIIINAQNNWWGTVDPVTITQRIYDHMDNSNFPVVDFTPFLDGPNGNPIDVTLIFGSISTDTTWTLAESPYVVIGNITVNQGIPLTIEPGVQVKFAGNYQFIINGTLHAVGTPSQNIIFTSNKTTPAQTDWNGIFFTDTSDDTTCIISYAVIEYSNQSIYIQNASPRIEYNTMRNNQYGVFVTNSSSPIIANNTIQNSAVGIRCQYSASPVITNNIIQNNSSGINCQYASTPTITNNTIINNSYGISLYGSLTNYPNPTVNNNSIYNNSSYNFSTSTSGDCSSLTINARNNWWGTIDPGVIAQKIYDYMDNSNSPVIDFTPFLDGPNGNPIDGNFVGGPIATNTTWLRSQSPYIVIGNVTVNQGITLTIEPGVQVKFAGNYQLTINGSLIAVGTQTQQIIFTSNKPTPAIGDWSSITFTDTSDDATCIISYAVVEYANYGIYTNSASPRIEHNTIINNQYGVYLYGNLTNYPNPTINNNSIYNNSSYNLYAYSTNNASSLTINAQNNWWGSIDPAVIGSKIYDYTDSASRPVVDFSHFLDGPNGNPVPGNFISGPVNQNTTWTLANSPYIVVGNIVVSQGITLTIDPGVQVKFAGNFSLTVNGSLHAVGTPAQNITFTSNKITPAPNDWQYIYFTDTSDDATCIISYAVVEYANYGIQTNTASPRIENSTIQNNNRGIYCQYTSTSNIANNTIINNSYGIYLYGNLTSYPLATINNNSVYNNSSYNLYAYGSGNCSTLTINAQNNWWGSIDPIAIAQTIFDYLDNNYRPVVDFTPFLDAPNGNPVLFIKLNEPIDNVLVPGVGRIIFNARIDEPANWTIEIKDSLNVTVKTFTASNSTAVFTEWYGYMDDGVTLVGDGEYTYTINAVSVSSGINAIPITGSISVDSQAVVSIISSPIENQVLTGTSNQIIGTANAFAGFNNYILSYAYDINYPEEYWVALIDSPIPVIEGLLYTLDVTDFMYESYVLRLKTFNLGGQVSTDYVAIKILNVFYVFADPPAISPNNDGINDILTIYANITLNSNWTLRIKDPNQTVVKTFTGSGNYINQIWDGKDEFNITVPDGQYTFQIEATDIQSGITTFSNIVNIPVDTISPTAEITSPMPAQVLTGEVPIIGTANDPNFYYYIMEYGLGQNPTSWVYFADYSYTPVVGGQLALWNTLGLEDGDYTLRLTVGDTAGNVATYDVLVVVDNIDITNVSVNPALINPYNSETTNIQYTIDSDAQVTLKIYNLNNDLVKTLLNSVSQTAGPQSVSWNGTNEGAEIVPQDVYTFTIEAQAGERYGWYECSGGFVHNGVSVNNFYVTPNFNPYGNELCQVQYTLNENALILMQVGQDENFGTYYNVIDWTPRPSGSHTEYWNGRDRNGDILDYYNQTYGIIVGVRTQTLPENSIIVYRPQIYISVNSDPYSIVPSSGAITRITYVLPTEGTVSVSICKPNLQVINNLLIDTFQTQGEHSLEWDGADSLGKKVIPDDYIVRVTLTDASARRIIQDGNITTR